MVEQVEVLLADAVEVEGALHRQRIGLLPLALFPVAPLRGDLADVDLGVEVGGEGVAVVAAVGVQDVDVVDLVEQVLLRVGAVDVGHARVEAAAQGGHVAGLPVALLEGPLLLVLELGLVGVLVVGGVQVGHAGAQAGLHDGQVLVGQGHVDQHVGLERLDQRDQRLDVVGIHLGGLDRTVQLRRDGAALVLVAAGQADLGEDFGMLGALVGNDAADAAGADNQDFAHGVSNPDREMFNDDRVLSVDGPRLRARTRCHPGRPFAPSSARSARVRDDGVPTSRGQVLFTRALRPKAQESARVGPAREGGRAGCGARQPAVGRVMRLGSR